MCRVSENKNVFSIVAYKLAQATAKLSKYEQF